MKSIRGGPTATSDPQQPFGASGSERLLLNTIWSFEVVVVKPLKSYAMSTNPAVLPSSAHPEIVRDVWDSYKGLPPRFGSQRNPVQS